MSRSLFLSISFVCGITISAVFKASPIAGMLASVVIVIALRFLPRSVRHLAILFALSGTVVWFLRDVRNSEMPDIACARVVEGTIEAPPRRQNDRTQLHLRINAISECIESRFAPSPMPHRNSAKVSILTGATQHLRRGDRIRFATHCQPRRFHAQSPDTPIHQRYFFNATIHSADDIQILTPQADAMESWLEARRRRLVQLYQRALPKESAAIAIALTTGQKHLLTRAQLNRFQESGTAHLLAVSGLHLGILALLTYQLSLTILRRIPRIARRTDVSRISATLTIPVIVFFTLLTGANPPVVRACIMAVSVLSARILCRQANSAQSLGLAACLLLAHTPQLLTNAGFQLSFCSVAGFILFCAASQSTPSATSTSKHIGSDNSEEIGSDGSRIFAANSIWRAVRNQLIRMRRALGRHLRSLSMAAIIAAAMTSPIVAVHFHSVPILAPLANIIVVPIVSVVVMPSLLFALVVSFIHFATAVATVRLCALPLQLLEKSVDFVAALSPTVDTERISAQLLVGICSLFLLLLITRRYRMAILTSVLGCMGAMGIFIASPPPFRPDALTIDFLDVGQGDATLLTFPGGSHWLVDAGGTARHRIGQDHIVPILKRQGIDTLEKLILTHPDPDHLSGIPDILQSITVHEIWDTGQATEETAVPAYAEMIQRAAQQRISLKRSEAFCGRTSVNGVTVDVLHPCVPHSNYIPTLSFNDNSIVFRVSLGGFSALLTGDLSADGESFLLQRHSTIQSHLLKLGHHGSKSSSTEQFLNRVAPRYAISSCGFYNRYRFPSADIQRRLQRHHIELLRTDQDGWIRATLSRKGIAITRQKKR